MLVLLDSVFYEALPYALMAFGIVLTYRYLRLIDLTFSASFVVGPSIAGALLISGVSFELSILAGLAAAIALASTTLALMWLLEIDGLLAGLLTSFGGFAIALMFTRGTLSLHATTTPFDTLRLIDYPWVRGVVPLHPSQIALFVFLVLSAKVAIDYFLDSELGLAFRAMEDERSRTFLLESIGMSEWRMRAVGVTLGNLMCAAAGLLVMLKEAQITANRGFDALIAVIAAYLLGNVLFERRTARATGGFLVRTLRSIAVFRPTTSALLGLLVYFLLLGLVSQTELPSSLPRLLMIALIIGTFVVTRWNEIRARWNLRRADQSYLVPESSSFEAAGVNVTYPGYPAPIAVLHNVNLEVPHHSAVLLQGPNGSGKTTLLRYLGGILQGRGCVSVPSKHARRRQRVQRRRQFLSYVSQDAQLGSSATLTVQENIALFARASKARFWRKWQSSTTASMPHAISNLVEHAGGAVAAHLSGGQRQILNIAGVIIRPDSPELVLLDEPLTHLDEANALACVKLIEDMLAQGKSIIIVQHDIEPTSTNMDTSESRRRLMTLITHTRDVTTL